MAEAVLLNIAEGIIKMLGSPTLEEIKLWWCVKDELEKLKNRVSTIQAVLLDAEEQSSQSHQVQVWLRMLKEAVYDADDLLDEVSTEVLWQQVISDNRLVKEVCLFFSSSNQLVYGIIMAHKIKTIRVRLEEIAANRKFHLQEISLEKCVTTREREQTHSSLPELVVGREDDRKAIVELLLSPNYEENVPIISIVGIGGLGKTTLAQLILNDETVKTHFELKLWVCVSNNFDVKLIVESILESVIGEKPINLELNTLKNLLHEKIHGKKYLIVLDDIWNEDSKKWFDLKDLLVGGASESRIIITTRSKKAAKITRPVVLYELQGLSETNSWNLFKQMAFERSEVPSLSIETIGKEIVKKCVGVPLAIKIIGALLYFKESLAEWLSFKDGELSKVDQQGSDILATLRLSYNHLPSHLKHCFAYCALFPKDYRINVESLIHLWMAQGCIKSSDSTQCLQDIGRECFMDLLWRSFFQEVEKDEWGNINSCKMHDLIHDLAMSVAGVESVSSDSNVACVDEKTRHLSINFDYVLTWQVPPSLLKASKVRTFLVPNKPAGVCKMERDGCHLIFSKLSCLRVLDLHDLGIDVVPCSIDKLKHLRYLDLSGNHDIKLLPDSVIKLQNLQVLKLEYCSRLQQLPKDIRKLVSLRHLSLDGCDGLTHIPCGIGKLTCLNKLSRFVVAKDYSVPENYCSGLSELQVLNNLRGKLEIVNLRYAVRNSTFEFKAVSLKEKQHLQCLKFEWKSYYEVYDKDNCENEVENDEMLLEALQPHHNLKALYLSAYRGVKYPSWLSFLSNLVTLTFTNCENIHHLPAFDQFPFLECLEICGLTALEYIDAGLNCGDMFFPSLKKLRLSSCPNLTGWQRCSQLDMGASSTAELPCFYCLSYLDFNYCPNLTSMPALPSLEELSVARVNMKSLEHVLKLTIAIPPSSSSSSFSHLKILRIWQIEDLEFMQAELLQLLTHLEDLEFWHCREITSQFNNDGMSWQGLRSLHSVKFTNIPLLTSLPKGLQHLPALHSLQIRSCPYFMSLPEWMGNLTTLQHLLIYECPRLEAKCRDNMGEYWPNIAHIPNITVEHRTVQWKGLYKL